MKTQKIVKNSNYNTGITLIALVITIIVLLILAGVTIAAISGNEGVLDKAQSAKTKTDIANAKESAMLKTTDYAQEFYQKKYVTNDSSVAGISNAGAYIAQKYATAVQTGSYYIQKDSTTGKIKVSTDAAGSNVIVEGTLGDNGTITWSDEVVSGGGGAGPIDETRLAKNILTLTTNSSDSTKLVSPYVNYTLKNGTTVPCKVLYNNGTNVEIIPVNPIDKIRLGCLDSTVTQEQINAEKATLPTTGLTYDAFKNDSFVSSTADEFAKAKASYNNFILNLNTKAREYMNTSLSDTARCVGTNPSSPNVDNPGYFSATDYAYLTNFKISGGNYYKFDTEDETDIEQLKKIDALQYTDTSNGNRSWIASRYASYDSNGTSFMILASQATRDSMYHANILTINGSGDASSYDFEYGFRPIFKLKSTVQIVDDGNNGTEDHPYNLY